MSTNGPLNFQLPEDIAANLGKRAEALRLSHNLSRTTLSKQSGVAEATLRKFERTGKISLVSMLQLADALGCMDAFLAMFPNKAATTLDDFLAPRRKRGTK